MMQKDVREKDEHIKKLKFDIVTQEDENKSLRDENSLYRGRIANLQRDIEMQGGAMNKISADSGTLGDQVALFKNRVA